MDKKFISTKDSCCTFVKEDFLFRRLTNDVETQETHWNCSRGKHYCIRNNVYYK